MTAQGRFWLVKNHSAEMEALGQAGDYLPVIGVVVIHKDTQHMGRAH